MSGVARSVDRLLGSVHDEEARGVVVRRPLPTTTLDQIDPFLQIDDVGPVEWEAGQANWGPELPLRGFDAATMVMDGDLEITDSTGRRDVVGPGDLVWRSAGRGVLVRELPSKRMRTRGGRLHLLRVWANVPRADKGAAPVAQHVARDRVPRVAFAPHISARVLAGSLSGTRAAVHATAEVRALLVELIAQGRLELDAPSHEQTLAYVVEGAARVGRERDVVRAGQAVVLARDGDRVPIEVDGGDAPCTLLFLSGAPIGEPVARYGPFVGATMADVQRATDDFRAGRFGKT